MGTSSSINLLLMMLEYVPCINISIYCFCANDRLNPHCKVVSGVVGWRTHQAIDRSTEEVSETGQAVYLHRCLSGACCSSATKQKLQQELVFFIPNAISPVYTKACDWIVCGLCLLACRPSKQVNLMIWYWGVVLLRTGFS